MKKIIKSFSILLFVILFAAINFIVLDTTTFAKQIGGLWSVTCYYDANGSLTGYSCTSGGSHVCGGCP